MLYTLTEILHGFVNIFASGRSTVKLAAFILLVVILLVWKFVFKEKKIPTLIRHEQRVFKGFYIATISTLVYGILGTVLLYSKLGLPLTKTIVVLSHNSLSTTHLFHTHVMKVAAGALLHLLGLNVSNADTGIAFLNFLPPLYIVIAVIASIIVLIISAYTIYLLWNKYSGKFWLQLLVTIVVFSITKNVIDGGLFDYETIPALVALWIMIFGFDWKKARVPLILASGMIVAALLGYAYHLNDLETTAKYFRMGGVLFVFYLGLYSLSAKLIPKRLSVLLCVIGIVGVVYPNYYRTSGNFEYLGVGVQNEVAYLGTYKDSISDAMKIDSIGRLNLFKVTTKAPATIANLLHEGKDNVLYYPVSVEWKTCLPIADNFERKIDVLSSEAISTTTTKHSSINITDIQKKPGVADFNSYSITFSLGPCVPRTINFVQESLMESGLTDSVIYFDLYDYND